MADVKNLAEQLVGLTVKEVQDLADFLKSEYGIEPAAAAVIAGPAAGPAAAAKDLVDGAPKPIKEGVDKATADELAAKLKEAGADVEIA